MVPFDVMTGRDYMVSQSRSDLVISTGHNIKINVKQY